LWAGVRNDMGLAGHPARIEILDVRGDPMPFQIESGKPYVGFADGEYWGHKYIQLLVKVSVPALGYTTAVLREQEAPDRVRPRDQLLDQPRVERPEVLVLDNGRIRAEFDPATAALRSLRDLSNGQEMIAAKRHAGFRMIDEDDAKGMTAWVIGRYMNIVPIEKDVRISPLRGARAQCAAVLNIVWRSDNQNCSVEVSLADGSDQIEYTVVCDFRETAAVGRSIPQLNFTIPLAYACRGYRYNIPLARSIGHRWNWMFRETLLRWLYRQTANILPSALWLQPNMDSEVSTIPCR
jgi:alpha-mannosidase